MSLIYMLRGLLLEWCSEYNIPTDKVRLLEFDEAMHESIMGNCTLSDPAVIKLSSHWLDLPRLPELLLRAVLWHEFCHADAWLNNGFSGHGKTFKEKLARKPIYHYADYAAKFMWGIWHWIYKW